jgi:two-component system response regulator GlrR
MATQTATADGRARHCQHAGYEEGWPRWTKGTHIFRSANDAFEQRYVLHLLKRTQRNVSKAARLAGIDRNCLYRMMKKHGIARKE